MKTQFSHVLKVTGVVTVALGSLVAASTAALAYPGVAASGSGSCSPSSASATVGSPFPTINCAFTFVDAQGAPVAGKTFTASLSGSGTQGATSLTTGTDGSATVAVTLPACSAAAGYAGQVTGSVGSGADVVSTQAAFTGICAKKTVTVSGTGCSDTGVTAPDVGDGIGEKFTCTFTANPAGTYAVAYAFDDQGQGSFIKKSASQSTSAGVFTAQVWAYGSQQFDITGTVRDTAQVDGGSATISH